MRTAIDSLVTGSLSMEESPAFQAAQDTSNNLLDRLRKEQFQFRNDSSSERLLEEAKDYFWVQCRISGEWLDTHPVFSGREHELDLQPVELFSGSVPAELQHQIGIQITLEIACSGKLEEKTLIAPLLIPTANLSASPITVTNVPEQSIGKSLLDVDDMEKLVQESAYFIPLVEGTQQSGNFFDLYGNTLDPAAAGTGRQRTKTPIF